MVQDAPHHRRVVDQRDDAHWAVTFWAFEWAGRHPESQGPVRLPAEDES